MLAKITTTLLSTPEELWTEISQPSSLQYVSAPLLIFVPKNQEELARSWEKNRPYDLKLFFLGILPLGSHRIVLEEIDQASNTIISRESGHLAKVWNHTIQFEAVDAHQLLYTDTIEIRAGLLTAFVWLFAHWFYRHRQRRWKRLLSRKRRMSASEKVDR